MSAFLVSPEHISALLRYAVAQGQRSDRFGIYYDGEKVTEHNAGQVGRALLRENVRSVEYRYGKRAGGLLWHDPERFRYQPEGRIPTAAEAAKLAACLDYQSCEPPDWQGTAACDFLMAVQLDVLNALPEYKAAAWEWRE